MSRPTNLIDGTVDTILYSIETAMSNLDHQQTSLLFNRVSNAVSDKFMTYVREVMAN